MASKKIPLVATFLITLLPFSCTRSAGPGVGGASEPKELRLYTWSEYFDQELIGSFEKETGAKVKLDYFASNEQMLAKLQLTKGQRGYDLILPSDYMVRNLVEMGLLAPIQKEKLPFLSEMEKEGLNPPYDPGMKYSVPLAVGVTGIAWNTKLLPKVKDIVSWKDFFEDPNLTGKVTLLDDTKEVLQAALLANGKDLSTATEAEVVDAFKYLQDHKKQWKSFTAETRPAIEGGDCALCMAYSGDVLSVSRDKPEVKFILPKTGATIWTDNFAIPANAGDADLAHKFIAKVLSAEGAKAFTVRTGYRTYNRKAKEALPKDVRENPIVYPTGGSFRYLVERKELLPKIDKEWALLKSQ